jgi:hypothetical protein
VVGLDSFFCFVEGMGGEQTDLVVCVFLSGAGYSTAEIRQNVTCREQDKVQYLLVFEVCYYCIYFGLHAANGVDNDGTKMLQACKETLRSTKEMITHIIHAT